MANPDYTMDEFDRTNLFDEELMPNAPTSPPSPAAPPPPPPPHQEFEADCDSPPLMEGKSARKEWGEPEPFVPEYNETNRLRTVNRLITEHKNEPGYRVKKSKDKHLIGKSVEELKKIRDGIYAKRSITSEQLQDAKQEKLRLK